LAIEGLALQNIEYLLRRAPLVRVKSQARQNGCVPSVGQVLDQLAGSDGRIRPIVVCICGKRLLASYHFIKDYSQREDVRGFRCPSPPPKLWGHVAWCAAPEFAGGCALCGHPEIGNDSASATAFLTTENNVACLKVAVQDPAAMGLSYPGTELPGDLP